VEFDALPVGPLFGERSESFVMTLTLDYAALMGGR
jgi:hypothetical protein